MPLAVAVVRTPVVLPRSLQAIFERKKLYMFHRVYSKQNTHVKVTCPSQETKPTGRIYTYTYHAVL